MTTSRVVAAQGVFRCSPVGEVAILEEVCGRRRRSCARQSWCRATIAGGRDIFEARETVASGNAVADARDLERRSGRGGGQNCHHGESERGNPPSRHGQAQPHSHLSELCFHIHFSAFLFAEVNGSRRTHRVSAKTGCSLSRAKLSLPYWERIPGKLRRIFTPQRFFQNPTKRRVRTRGLQNPGQNRICRPAALSGRGF